MITQNFDLNMIPDSAPVVIHCDQYDHGTGRLVANLYNGSLAYSPSGTATIQGMKPDGRGFEYSATLSGNTVTADLTEQMAIVAGRVRCQFVITESSGRIGTFVFFLDVQKSALPADSDMSESEYQIIEEALEEVQEAAADAEGFSEDAEAWATGKRSGTDVPSTDPAYHNNSKYWSDRAAELVQGGIRYKGSILFANIPTTGLNSGDMWNIEDDFTTDSRFEEGAGIACAAGTNIAWNGSKWDLLALVKAGALVDLSDVQIVSAADGQALVWDATAQKWKNGNSGLPIPIYYVPVSATPTSSEPIVINGLDFSKVFKLVVSTTSTTPVSLGSIYINNGTETKRYYAYSKRTDSTGVTNVTSFMDICYGSASYCAALEFLCHTNKDNTYLALYAGDDYVPTNLNALSDVTLGTLADGEVLKYDSATQKWVNGTVSGGGVQSDWNQSDSTALDFIKNKPDLSKVVLAINPTDTSFTTTPGAIWIEV